MKGFGEVRDCMMLQELSRYRRTLATRWPLVRRRVAEACDRLYIALRQCEAAPLGNQRVWVDRWRVCGLPAHALRFPAFYELSLAFSCIQHDTLLFSRCALPNH